MARIRIEAMAAREPFYVARVARLPDVGRLSDPAVKALAINLREATQELHRALRSRATSPGPGRAGAPHLPSAREVAESIQNASPVALADELVTHLGVSLEGVWVAWLVVGVGMGLDGWMCQRLTSFCGCIFVRPGKRQRSRPSWRSPDWRSACAGPSSSSRSRCVSVRGFVVRRMHENVADATLPITRLA